MKRIGLCIASCVLTLASAQAQLGQPLPGEEPSVAHAIPLSYVGGSGRVSLGIDDDGNSTGEALGVFDNTGEHAYIGQLWWGHGGAGGLQLGYNWLWGGMSLAEAKAHPERVTVARTMLAIDQNQFKDRKATFGFGIERPQYFIDAYLSTAASGKRAAGSQATASQSLLEGSDPVGSYTQVETVTVIDGYSSSAYDAGIGLRAGHFSDALGLRLHAGMDYQRGSGDAHVFTVSAGADKYLGTRGWSMSGQVAHDQSSTDPLLGTSSDTRVSLFLRYEFGGRVFVPTSELATPAWIARALVNPPTNHPRTVQTYTRRTSSTTTTTVGPKQYTNHNPIARDDSISVAANAGPTLIDVLANDSDADGDTLTVTAVTAAAHGEVVLAGGSVTYAPADGYSGSDRFAYTVSDGRGGIASASVTVTVTAQPNRAPAARDDSASTPAGQPVTIDVLANDSDPDGDALDVIAMTQPAHGSVSQGDGGKLTYTPDAGFEGTDRFSYTISDGQGGSASAQVTITVAPPPNRDPVARDDFASTQAGQAVTIDLLANDDDPDGDVIVLGGFGQPRHGSVQAQGDGTVVYTPDAQFSGTDRFRYWIEDGRGGSASAAVTITVAQPPNRAPVAVDDVGVVLVGATIADVDVLANDSDPDGDPLTVTAVTQGQHGQVVILPDQRVRYTWDGVAGPASDQYSYTISDGRGGSATATVTLTLPVPPPNQPPVAMDDTAVASFTGAVDIDVLANDSDPDGDPLTVTAVTQGQYGTVAIQPDNRVRYTLVDPGGASVDVFTYTISDGRGGTATANVTVSFPPPPNLPPIAGDDSYFVDLAQVVNGVSLDVLINDSDPDGDPLQIVAVTQPVGAQTSTDGTQVFFVSSTVGTFSFSYTISDGRGGTASATVIVEVM